MFDQYNRHHFLAMAIFFEGSLIGLAALLGWWLTVNPLDHFAWDWHGTIAGLAGTVPMFLLFALAYRFPVGPLKQIKSFLIRALGPYLLLCRWYDLLLLGAVAGISEELVFRGVLHPKFGIVWSNVVFGAVHWITPAYAVTAGLIGAYLGWLCDYSENLLAPIIAHGLYDFLAFLVVARDARRNLAPEAEIAEAD
ncbi:MAG: CPBP family intramembrane metalloprotease [Planctomycetes bacterium]|nr:CPBP family intramembrane metalloprotease [Planctomycetota bacterium]